MRNLFIIAAVVGLAGLPACKKSAADPPADNTARNQRDRGVTPTADNSGNDKADVDLTQRIRKAVMADDSLSMNAHNCKIVVNGGRVSLAGPVANDDERAKIEKIAASIAGDGKVINELEVTR
jgi:osmotically-inducible protein OsmY